MNEAQPSAAVTERAGLMDKHHDEGGSEQQQDKLRQYARPQRADWADYIRSKGFNLS